MPELGIEMFVFKILLFASMTIYASPPAAAFELTNIPCIGMYIPISTDRYGVTSQVNLTWMDMDALCRSNFPGYALVTDVYHFTPRELGLCPEGSIVAIAEEIPPYGVKWYKANNDDDQKKDTELSKQSSPNASVLHSAIHWPNPEPFTVDNEPMFRCGVCQLMRRLNVVTQGVYPPHNNSIYAYDLELISDDSVDDVGLVANGSNLTNRLLTDLAEVFNISVKALRWHGAKLIDDGLAVVHVYYDRKDDKMDWDQYLRRDDQYFTAAAVTSFKVTAIKLSTECLQGKSLKNTIREPILTGDVDIKVDRIKGHVYSKECYWDAKIDGAIWSDTTEWWIKWEPCELNGDYIFQMRKMRGHALKLALKNMDVQTAMSFNVLLNGTNPLFTFKSVVEIANCMIVVHTQDTKVASAGGMMAYKSLLNLGNFFLIHPLMDDQLTNFIHTKYIHVLVTALLPDDPVAGFALTLATNETGTLSQGMVLTIANESSPPSSSHVVVTVSTSIASTASRLAIFTFAAHLDTNDRPSLDASIGSWMAVVQVAFKRNASLGGDADFVDIAFKPAFRNASLRGKCAERNFDTDEWLGDKCRILKSTRNDMLVCRCTRILFQETDVTIGSYLIYGFDASLSSYLSNNLTLIIVIVIVSVMSILGLFSVIFTGICFPAWRKDQGHKIFMQMILALTVNLVIGFFNNFISIDTKSVTCVAIGVVRHYSFLAMFCWMMVLSGLQMKRITTIVGAKSTSHLILKVSLVAWGLPLVPIIILLAWDVASYKSEVSNRGYCYPEGIAFEATVQIPAGIILIGNLFSFVVILNHIYGWVQFGDDIVIRKHGADDRAAQLRRLSTSLFVFFLFGFTWVFHFLSEEGVINSEFLFEFMFLITASFHLLMLSLFFILLDKNTRDLWVNALCSKKRRERPENLELK